MIAVVNSLPVEEEEGAADRIVERFTESRAHVQGFPGFVSMEVLRSENGDEVLVVTRWRDQARSSRRPTGGAELLRGHRSDRLQVAVEPEAYGRD